MFRWRMLGFVARLPAGTRRSFTFATSDWAETAATRAVCSLARTWVPSASCRLESPAVWYWPIQASRCAASSALALADAEFSWSTAPTSAWLGCGAQTMLTLRARDWPASAPTSATCALPTHWSASAHCSEVGAPSCCCSIAALRCAVATTVASAKTSLRCLSETIGAPKTMFRLDARVWATWATATTPWRLTVVSPPRAFCNPRLGSTPVWLWLSDVEMKAETDALAVAVASFAWSTGAKRLGSSDAASGAAAAPSGGDVDAGAPVLQSQVQFHVQLQSQACCHESVHSLPSAIVQFHVQLHIPVAPPVAVVAAPVAGAAAGWLVQSQFQTSLDVGAASVDVPGSGVQLLFQIQFHVQSPAGAPFAGPGRTMETFVFELPLTVTTPSVGLEPVAVALFACET